MIHLKCAEARIGGQSNAGIHIVSEVHSLSRQCKLITWYNDTQFAIQQSGIHISALRVWWHSGGLSYGYLSKIKCLTFLQAKYCRCWNSETKQLNAETRNKYWRNLVGQAASVEENGSQSETAPIPSLHRCCLPAKLL